ncbi:SRPBCC family protein [Nocardioides speluncae]|uniref:SRPBCC family protein n=1 Tax=Nocardioides speluncae TaxID=2670337 RepID=UPI000D6911BB|nr:SRPBCC family protein [Nocardioides speluncae]
MELTHTFTVPTPVAETWAHFQDIAVLAECFPGAQVTAADGETFQGTCKVKLGPIALVYAGTGTFVERDEDAHTFRVQAKGKDKRGNGTAGAEVRLSMTGLDAGTEVQVLTDLSVTGKPAQFGRGVMQDVSDKLLGQFVGCLEQRLADQRPAVPEREERNPEPPPSAPAQPLASEQPRASGEPDALDLGRTVLPVLLKSYGKQAAVAVLALVVLVLLVWWLLG